MLPILPLGEAKNSLWVDLKKSLERDLSHPQKADIYLEGQKASTPQLAYSKFVQHTFLTGRSLKWSDCSQWAKPSSSAADNNVVGWRGF